MTLSSGRDGLCRMSLRIRPAQYARVFPAIAGGWRRGSGAVTSSGVIAVIAGNHDGSASIREGGAGCSIGSRARRYRKLEERLSRISGKRTATWSKGCVTHFTY